MVLLKNVNMYRTLRHVFTYILVFIRNLYCLYSRKFTINVFYKCVLWLAKLVYFSKTRSKYPFLKNSFKILLYKNDNVLLNYYYFKSFYLIFCLHCYMRTIPGCIWDCSHNLKMKYKIDLVEKGIWMIEHHMLGSMNIRNLSDK